MPLKHLVKFIALKEMQDSHQINWFICLDGFGPGEKRWNDWNVLDDGTGLKGEKELVFWDVEIYDEIQDEIEVTRQFKNLRVIILSNGTINIWIDSGTEKVSFFQKYVSMQCRTVRLKLKKTLIISKRSPMPEIDKYLKHKLIFFDTLPI